LKESKTVSTGASMWILRFIALPPYSSGRVHHATPATRST
jgi:hypothetical protein